MIKKQLKTAMAGACMAMAAVPAVAQEKPNIIFIYADDMGYSDLQCYGSQVNDTPNFDRMASEGMRFTDFYAGANVSTPSRACLMTGRYPTRMGIYHVFFPESFTGMDPNEITMAEMLKEEGYSTAIFGKWHLGIDWQYRPLRQGFDEFYGTACSIDNPPVVYIDNDTPTNVPANKDSITFVTTQKALSFIERKKDGPFFCYVAYNMPHVPIAASDNFKGKSRNGLYGDVIMELDWGIGEIMAKVKELGLDENTIICFSSDNGPWLTEGPYGGCALPLAWGKGTTWDGGHRVPMIVRWPGHIEAGQVTTDVALMADWFPTFASICGGDVPTDRVIDGYDISPILFGTGKRPNEDIAFIDMRGLNAYRSGDWKLKLPEREVKGNYWQADTPAHDTVLFNLRDDIGEQQDVKEQHPEIVEMILHKMDSLTATGLLAPRIFQTEWQTDMLNQQQRMQNVLKAAEEGRGPASEKGQAILEYYQAMEKFQKSSARGSIF